MQKFFLSSLICTGVCFLAGCGSPPPPASPEKVKELNAAMENDMKSMMQNIPSKPGGTPKK